MLQILAKVASVRALVRTEFIKIQVKASGVKRCYNLVYWPKINTRDMLFCGQFSEFPTGPTFDGFLSVI